MGFMEKNNFWRGGGTGLTGTRRNGMVVSGAIDNGEREGVRRMKVFWVTTLPCAAMYVYTVVVSSLYLK